MDENEPKSLGAEFWAWVAGMAVLVVLGALFMRLVKELTGKEWSGKVAVLAVAFVAAGVYEIGRRVARRRRSDAGPPRPEDSP